MAKMTLEEALEAATVDEELVAPVNEIILINPETRIINMPDSEKLFGVIQDGNVERKHFKCPKIVGDNVDLSKHQLFINYVPSKSDGTYDSEENVQSYFCEDVEVSGDYIKFSWKLSENVMRIAGYVAFAICAKSVDENGNLRTKWHTNIAIGKVLDTLPDGNEIAEIYPDLLVQLLDRMDAMENGETLHNVLYAKQELTEEQQTQARTNIGAAAASEVSKLSEDIATKASAIKEKASGELIVVTDSDEAKPLGLAIDGKSYQKQYSGKNLLKNNSKSNTVNGITFTVNDDGSITVNGTATEIAKCTISSSVKIEANVSYTLSGCPSGGSFDTYYLNCGNIGTDYGAGITSKKTELSTGNYVQICVKNGVVCNNLVFKPMLRYTEITDSTYEPYCGGIPSPNPSYPQEIRNIGVYDGASGKYAIEVKCTGKNLIDQKCVPVGSGNKLHWLKAGQYTALRDSSEAPGNTWYIKATDKNGNVITDRALKVSGSYSLNGSAEWFYGGTSLQRMLFELKEDSYVSFGSLNGSGNTYLHLEYGTEATEYEPYKETTATVLLDEPLRKGDKAYWNGEKMFVERKRAVIESYNGETINTDYLSTTGSLDNGALVEYQLVTPNTVEIDIDLGELSMFYPTTILSNDCNANMEVTYIADTKAYVDKKITEVITAML